MTESISGVVFAHITVVVNSIREIFSGNGERAFFIEAGADVHADERADVKMARPIVRVSGNFDEGVGAGISVKVRLRRRSHRETKNENASRKPILETHVSHKIK